MKPARSRTDTGKRLGGAPALSWHAGSGISETDLEEFTISKPITPGIAPPPPPNCRRVTAGSIGIQEIFPDLQGEAAPPKKWGGGGE